VVTVPGKRYPPIMVPWQRYGDYIDLLWEYQNAVGKIQRNSPLVPDHPAIERFTALLQGEWRHTVALVETARKREREREAIKNLSAPAKPKFQPLCDALPMLILFSINMMQCW
jgi:hypothetical protein